MHKPSRGILGYIIIVLLFIMIAAVLFGDRGSVGEHIKYNQFLEHVKNKQVSVIAIRESSMTLYGLYKGSRIPESLLSDNNFDFYTVFGSDLYDTLLGMRSRELGAASSADAGAATADNVLLTDLDFTIIQLPPVQPNWFLEFLPYLILLVIMVLFWWFMMRQQMGANNKAMSFGKSRARMADGSKNKITFADVAGADEEKEELREIVDFLKNPKQYVDLGARIPKGVLLVGPPGTGKTLLAKAVAGEANVPFYSISGSDFVEMFVGVGASRVRDLFDQAKRTSPSIVFIDEIDAVGRRRGAGLGGGHDEREQTLNQLLVEMDGFSTNEGVIVLAATNRRDILDPALLRPGRFDRQVTVNYPDLAGRVAILKVHSRGKPLADDVDLNNIAKRTPFSTGADLENIMNEAALLAARSRSPKIDQPTLINAVERVQMGPEKRSHKVLEQDKKVVAYHEAGHAVVGYLLPLCDDVHLITIMPRGRSGGHTLLLPEEEPDFSSRAQLLSQVSMALGGHAAESIALGDIHTGSGSDLQRATELCRSMVTHFGMSDKLGTIFLGNDQQIFVGMEFGQSREFSEEVAATIDREVKRLLDECYKVTCGLIQTHIDDLRRVAEALIERETLNRVDFERLMRGEPLGALVLPENNSGETAQSAAPASEPIKAPWNEALGDEPANPQEGNPHS